MISVCFLRSFILCCCNFRVPCLDLGQGVSFLCFVRGRMCENVFCAFAM